MRQPLFGGADGRLLPEGRTEGPMPWVIAIMMFLTALAAAAGMSLDSAARSLDAGNRITVQIVEANEVARDVQTRAAAEALAGQAGVAAVQTVEQEELRRLIEPWLGAAVEADIPIPTMIEVELTPEGRGNLVRIRQAVEAAAPSARVDDNAAWLAPLERLIASLRWLAIGLVALTAAAAAATVVLAARAALDTHRETIEVLHLMGTTDHQVARLFQRRIAFDALFGGLIGLGGAAASLWLVGRQIGALGSELVGSVALPDFGWLVLLALPVAATLLAMLVARITILRALNKSL